MIKPKISFIVPVYNTSIKELKDCLVSILAIDYLPYEILLIDDGSREEQNIAYRQLLHELNAPQIRFLEQENQGVSEARNSGMANAVGEYIMFVDSDDLLVAEAFRKWKADAEMIVFDYFFVKGTKHRETKRLNADYGCVAQPDVLENAFNGKPASCWGILYSLDYLRTKQIRFDKRYIQSEDMLFNFEVMTSNPKVLYVDCKAYQYNFSANTAFNRWKKRPEAMMFSGCAYHQIKMESAKRIYGDNNNGVYEEIITARIREVYGNAVDLCCVGQDTAEHRKKVEEMMRSIQLPAGAGRQTRYYHRCIVKEQWNAVRIVAKARLLYLRILKI